MDDRGPKQLSRLAGALIVAASLASCGDGTTAISYDGTDKGLKMPEPKKADREKCYGIALAQFNDCAAGPKTDCAGTATKDYMPDRWKYVGRGQCEKLGGSLIPGEPLPDDNG